MNLLLRVKANIQVFQEAYDEKYKGRMKIECAEDKLGDQVIGVIITFTAFLGQGEGRTLEKTIKLSTDMLEKEHGNIFSSRLLKANHDMREMIVMDALGLPWENAKL